MALIVVLVIVFAGGNSKKKVKTAGSTTVATTAPAQDSTPSSTAPATAKPFVYGTAPCPDASGSSAKTLSFSAAPAKCLTGTKATATVKTSVGTVVVDLDLATTPGTANNFAFLSNWHYYDGTKLFRIDKSIDVIQGGSPHTQGADDPGPGYTIPDEGAFSQDPTTGELTGPYKYQAGDLAMARSQGANSGSAQFFFITGPNAANLNSQGTYVVFGHVSSGMDVLQRIASAPTKPLSGGLGDTPDPPITIQSVTIAQQ